MNRLFEIGFQVVGNWYIENEILKYELRKEIIQQNVLYAFIAESRLLYIGKTTKTLRRRMNGYLRPSPSQKTNIRNHKSILLLLESKNDVEILAMPDTELHQYGAFKLNYPAALEDSVIEIMKPEWNGGRSSVYLELDEESNPPETSQEAQLEKEVMRGKFSFEIKLHKTYIDKGFFNVPKQFAHHFAEYETEVDIYCGKEKFHIKGTISRSHPENGNPRIRGFKNLHNWFVVNHSELDQILVEVINSTTIQIY